MRKRLVQREKALPSEDRLSWWQAVRRFQKVLKCQKAPLLSAVEGLL